MSDWRNLITFTEEKDGGTHRLVEQKEVRRVEDLLAERADEIDRLTTEVTRLENDLVKVATEYRDEVKALTVEGNRMHEELEFLFKLPVRNQDWEGYAVTVRAACRRALGIDESASTLPEPQSKSQERRFAHQIPGWREGKSSGRNDDSD